MMDQRIKPDTVFVVVLSEYMNLSLGVNIPIKQKKSLISLGIEPTTSGIVHRCSTD